MRSLIPIAMVASLVSVPVLAGPASGARASDGPYQGALLYPVQYQGDQHDDQQGNAGNPNDHGQGSSGQQGGPYNRSGQYNDQYSNQGEDANFHAEQHYRQGRNYREHTLSQNDRVYHGQDNRYYCRRSDGTTGLIVGGIGGGVLGNLIAPGGSKMLGTLLGGGLGAVAGNAVGRNRVRCR